MRRIGCLLVRVVCGEQARLRRLIANEGAIPSGRATTHPYGSAMDELRVRYLTCPALQAVKVQVDPDQAVIVAVRR